MNDAVKSLFQLEEWPSRWQSTADMAGYVPQSLKQGAIEALGADDLEQKVIITRATALRWFGGTLALGGLVSGKPPDRPGRPERPLLVPPSQTKKRSIRSQKGRFALLHAIAHIELNAIDLALDIIARFVTMAGSPVTTHSHRMPRSFYDGWMRVALEEAKHFTLLRERLRQLGGEYGDLDAHDGLWESAQETGHSLTARLAVVPLILEARGLDITPSLIEQMNEVGDADSARIFHIIYRDEQGHVAVGAKWFRYLCLREGQKPAEAFQKLVRQHFRGNLKPPFNDLARARAGLEPGFYRALSSSGN